MMAAVRAVDAMLARAAGRVIDEAERRFCDLVGRGQRCLRRVLLPLSMGSRSRQAAADTTLGGCILAYAVSYARTYAVAVVAWAV